MPSAKKPPRKPPAATGPFNNNPNIQFGVRSFRVTVGWWQHRRTFDVEIRGNCRGLDLFDEAVDAAWSDLPVGPDMDTDVRDFATTDPKGGKSHTNGCTLGDFREMVVSIVQIGVKAEADRD